jgi:hypothetical protein
MYVSTSEGINELGYYFYWPVHRVWTWRSGGEIVYARGRYLAFVRALEELHRSSLE